MKSDLENGYLPGYYETYPVEDWLDPVLEEIKAEMSDQELEELVENWKPDSNVVLVGRLDILEYAKQVRDNLVWEKS